MWRPILFGRPGRCDHTSLSPLTGCYYMLISHCKPRPGGMRHWIRIPADTSLTVKLQPEMIYFSLIMKASRKSCLNSFRGIVFVCTWILSLPSPCELRFFFNATGFICTLNCMLLSVWFYMADVRIASDWSRHFSSFHKILGHVGDNFIVQYFNCSLHFIVHDRHCNLTFSNWSNVFHKRF